MTRRNRKECECCGVEEDLHLRSSNSIYDIESKTIRLEMAYLCTECKELTEKQITDNGWKNYETWNVALHISNDPTIHIAAVWANDYTEFCEIMRHDFGYTETPDQVAYNDTNLDIRALSELIEETKADNEED